VKIKGQAPRPGTAIAPGAESAGFLIMHVWNLREPFSAWSHCAALVLAVPGTWVLLRRSVGDLGKRLSLLVYGLGLVACYAASTLYHGVQLPPERLEVFVRLDSLGIFALIAGSYTPLARNLMRGAWRASTLSAVWGTAGVAMVVIASGGHFTSLVGTCVYLGMGWGVIFCYARIARVVSHRALLPVVIGGLFYSVGALIYLSGRPVLWPGVFGAHDLFHLFVIAGSLAHYWFILKVIVPFRWRSDSIESEPAAPSPPPISVPTSTPERVPL
jgi:hemolysin III